MIKKKPLDDAFSYCRDVVARDDPDRYLASLFAPRAARPAIWALLAFNQDIARVRDNVTDPNLGYIRLQWMREQIEGIYRNRQKDRATPAKAGVHGKNESSLDPDFPPTPYGLRRTGRRDGTAPVGPLYCALASVIDDYDLPRDLFDVLIDAREVDLGTRGPQTIEELIDYADRTSTPLLELCVRVCLSSPRRRGSSQIGVLDSRMRGNDNLKNIALAYALIGLVRASEFHRDTRGWHMIPPGENVAGIITLAREYLKRREASVPTDLPAMIRAMGVVADIHARRIEKVGFDVASPALTIPPPFLALRVWARVRGVVFSG